MTVGVAAASYSRTSLPNQWLDWLHDHVDTDWRPGQWIHGSWLFTGTPDDPTTTVDICHVQACETLVGNQRLCKLCRRALRKSDRSFDEFIVSYAPARQKRHPAEFGKRPQCLATRETRCPRTDHYSGLCVYHYYAWRRAIRQDPQMTLENWLATGNIVIPTTRHPQCRVPACDREASGAKLKLCAYHLHQWRRTGAGKAVEEWAQSQIPYVSDHQFTLIHLDDVLRWEALYAIQQRDARGGRIDPVSIRATLRIMAKYPSFANLSEPQLDDLVQQSSYANLTVHIVEFTRILRNAHDEMTGHRPCDRLVWDLVDVGICPDPSLKGGARRRRGIDFGEIRQPWLRSLTMAMAREQTRAYAVNELQKVAVLASRVLAERTDRGMEVAQLKNTDADAIAEAIRQLKIRDDTLCSSQYRRQVYLRFFRMIDFGRRQGLLENLPISFGRDRSHVIPHDPIEEEFGKSIPIHIQRQLDSHIDDVGRHLAHGELTVEQRHQMFRTIYTLLRDTGRRCREVASLKTSYLTRDSNGPILIYDNHKAGRYGRRLPIVQSTANAFEEWLQIRATLDLHEASHEYLFPGSNAHQAHVTSSKISHMFRSWVDNLERLDCSDVDQHGNPIPFDRHLIHARAFRHTYAQRHADNGTPIDVLRELMDHKSIQTTGLYYVITADRKRDAVQKVGQYTIDRDGAAAPLTQSTRYQMRSVAVPFGNCIEPSNVKAGGQACPIRFQCAGCGFYRPDPSYIPAIEEHINSLRADRETAQALNAAGFVIDNLNAQIAAFNQALNTMRQRLESLEPAERDRVEDAAATLRKARAGAALPLTVIHHQNRENADDPDA